MKDYKSKGHEHIFQIQILCWFQLVCISSQFAHVNCIIYYFSNCRSFTYDIDVSVVPQWINISIPE
jgi:hypothetical protein